MPFGPPWHHYMPKIVNITRTDGGELDYDESTYQQTLDEHVNAFLQEYASLVDKCDLMFAVDPRTISMKLYTVDHIISSNEGGNDYRNYHNASPETKEGLLEDIVNMTLKE